MNTPRHGPRRAAHLFAAAALSAAPATAVAALCIPLAAQTAAAQSDGRITGRVTSAGAPVSDAHVIVNGTRFGANTDADGRFTILGVPAGSYTLRVQRLGYAPTTRPITVVAGGEAVTTDVDLASAPTVLNRVLSVGYTNERSRDVSGAVASVGGEDILDQKVATVEEALRGRVAGVQIAATGQPGRSAQLIIRGQNSFGSPSPLYVVDGMYVGQQNPNLNPEDIQSIEVLKDASAAAQYGAQASNGVVIIRTRRGQDGPAKIALSTYYGFQTVPNRIPVASTAEFQRIYQEAYANAGQVAPVGVTAATSINTDWQDALFQTGAIQNYNLQASGGTSTASYLISGGVLDQHGTVINTNFRRYSVRANSEARRGRLTVGENLAVSQANQRAFSNGIFGGVTLPLIDVVSLLPTIPVRDPNNPGGYGYGSTENPNYGVNPVAALENNYNTFRGNQVLGSAYGEVKLIGGLRYRLNLGINYNDSLATNWTSTTQLRYLTPVLGGASLQQSAPNSQQLLYENLLSYDGVLGGGAAHRLSAVAGLTQQRNDYRQLTASRTGFPNEQLRQLNAGLTTKAANGGFQIPFRTNSSLARATYAFRDRYLLTGSVRHDCSTRFSPSDRCGNFGAGSVGWVASEESFWGSVPVLGRADFFKLRASSGILGDQNIGDFAYGVPVSQNSNYLFGGEVNSGATIRNLANTSLKWQRNRSTNVGLDLGLLDNALSVTADYYVNDADQVLLNAPLPPSLASASNPAVNAGKVRNAGFEFGARHRMDRGDFRLNSAFTLTTTANRVVSLGNGGQPLFAGLFGVAKTDVGHPIGQFFVKKTCGIFQSAEQVATHAAQPDAQPGDLCFVDKNKDGRIDDADRFYIGSPVPKLTSGLFLDSKWRAWDLGLNFRGAFGNKIYNAVKLATERTTGLNNLRKGYNPWTPTNTKTSTPRAVFGDAINGDPVSDRWLENGRYVRLQNVVVGYTLPAMLAQRFGGTTGEPRVYFNAQNVYTWTKYSGFDPEVLGFGDPLARGVDDGFIYPNPRTYTFGLDLRF